MAKRRHRPRTETILPAGPPLPRLELEFSGANPPRRWPLVSLCMIVKNEEANLLDCVRSVGDLAGEVIIVDTGSTDRTVELAHSLGATVKHFTWINDFAAARNESIKDAAGDWIFWMDADDRLSLLGVAQLKEALVSGRADVYHCRVSSLRGENDRVKTTVNHARLFKNRLGLHFDGPLHETMEPSAARQGLTIAQTNIDITHVGYDTTDAAIKAKARRNLAIVEARLAREPDNLFWQFHRATCLSNLEKYTDAAPIYEQVIAMPPAELDREFYLYQAYVALLDAYLKLNQPAEARRVVKLALAAFPHRRSIATTAGLFYLIDDDPAAAVAVLTAGLSLPESGQGHDWSPGRLEETLGVASVLTGDLPTAHRAFGAMLAARNISPPPAAAQLEQQARELLAAAQFAPAIALLEPVAAGQPALLRLLCAAQVGQRQWGSAARHLAQAMALAGSLPGDWASLAEYLLRAGKPNSAARPLEIALAEEPDKAAPLTVAALLAMHRREPNTALSALVQALLANPAYQPAHDTLAEIAGALQLSPAEAVRQHGLRLLAQKQFQPAAEALLLLTQLVPADVEAYKALAVALNALGMQDDALAAWQTAQRLES
ncbi:MAG: hypothetical protein FOGNACKC_03671 [Anaerolineae bacterium]|nr:hypothetical protein [Anaerolineae bacterium]